MKVSEEDKRIVNELIGEGKKIEAIKYVKKTFGIDLHTSKKLVDHLDEHLEFSDTRFDRELITERAKKGISGGKGMIFWFSLSFILTGLLLFGVGVYFVSTQFNLITEGEEVQGKVISNPYSPLVQYTYNGKEYEHQAEVSTDPPSYYIGERVELFIDPHNPEDAMINDFTERWFVPILMGGMGLMFFTIGVFVRMKFRPS